MAEIILAFIAGVVFGACCVYLLCRRVIRDNIRTLEKLKLESARLRGSVEVLNDIFGIDEENETEDSKWPEPNVNRFNKPSFLDDNHNSSGLLDED